MCANILPACLSVYNIDVVAVKVRRGLGSLGSGADQWLWTTKWVLRVQATSSARGTGWHRAISPALSLIGLRFSWRLSFVLGSLFYFILFLLVYYFNISIEFSHFKLFFLFLNVCVCMCLRGCGSTCVWKPEADVRCLPPLLSTVSLRQGLFLNPQFANSSFSSEPAFLFLPPKLGDYRELACQPGFYVGSGEKNSSHSTCLGSNLSTESSPQSLEVVFLIAA